VHATISAAKNDGVDVEAYTAKAQVIFERKIADVCTVPGPPAAGRRHGLRRPPQQHGAPVQRHPTCSSTTASGSATCWSTVPGHQPRPERARHPAVVQHRNICIVGDSDQCLPPETMVATPAGPQRIDEVRSATGAGHRQAPTPRRARSPRCLATTRARSSG
jgi:hypothetical protein